jgi:hypothetical protein
MSAESCDMHRVERHGESEPGDFYFRVDDKGQRWFHCLLPGKGVGVRIPVRPVVTAGLNGGNYWDWDGNESQPTLTPSINAEPEWHGWVRAGRMVSC